MRKIYRTTLLVVSLCFLLACSNQSTLTDIQSTKELTTSISTTKASETSVDLPTSTLIQPTTQVSTNQMTFPTTQEITTQAQSIQSCEVQGISDCDFTLAQAHIDGNFYPIETYEMLSEAQVVLKTLTDPSLVIINEDFDVLAMKYGAINFKTKAISQTTTLGHTGFSSPTYLNGHYNVDGLYLDAQGIVIYGMIAGLRFEVVSSQVELIPHNHLGQAYSYYQVINGELVHHISSQLRTGSFQSIGAIDIAPDYLEEGVRYYSYDNHYFYTDIIQMTDDLRHKTYEHAINHQEPYYNYYQYMSFRSHTNYTAEELNTYINSRTSSSSALYDAGQDFIDAQESVYINAAMELAFAIHESGWGMSAIARDKNNLFGIDAYDHDPYNSAKSFDSIQACIEYHVQYFLGTRYFDPTYHVAFGTNFGNKYQGMNYKYASDAYWGEKIAKHYYQLDKALGFKDRHSDQIALLDPEALGYYGPSLDSQVIYKPQDYNYDGLWVSFPIVWERDGFYALRLPIALNDDLQLDPFEVMSPTDIFYVLKEDVIIINE